MAELTKKLNISKNGATQQAKLYTTTAEAGSTYQQFKVDNTNVYVSLGSSSDSRATLGRVKRSGTEYAIMTSGKPPYNKVSYTTAGTYTWTCPAGVTTAKVTVAGGGGGGFIYLPNIETTSPDTYAGGQGALTTQTVSVTSGTTYSVVVGAGGIVGYGLMGTTNVYATAGGTSSACGVSAQGGGAAARGSNGTSYGSGGAGGLAMNGSAGWVYIEYGGDI